MSRCWKSWAGRDLHGSSVPYQLSGLLKLLDRTGEVGRAIASPSRSEALDQSGTEQLPARRGSLSRSHSPTADVQLHQAAPSRLTDIAAQPLY